MWNTVSLLGAAYGTPMRSPPVSYDSLRSSIDDLDRAGHLRRITEEVDRFLEAAEIQRRVFAVGGPALLFENVRGSRFPLASNLFGTMERVRFVFRDSLDGVRALVAAKVDPRAFVTDVRRAVIDARIKAHHAPPLVEDPSVTRRVDRLGVRGASLHGIL